MLNYLVTGSHTDHIRTHRKWWAGSLSRKIHPMPYETLGLRRCLPRGCYIFSDLERLTPAQLDLAKFVWQTLAEQGLESHLYNNPFRVLLREPLLRKLHEMGMNPHAVRRINENLDSIRYPVFIRQENDHEGVPGGLIKDRAALDSAIADIRKVPGAAEHALIIEFVDTADASGLYRKYSAFCVAGTIIPRHILVSRHWMVKNASVVTPEIVREEERYLAENPHEKTVKAVFEAACIDYGRIDYSMLGDRLVTWEINSNPVATSPPAYVAKERLHLSTIFCGPYNARLAEIMNVPVGPSIPLKIPSDKRQALAAGRWDCLMALGAQATRRGKRIRDRVGREYEKISGKVKSRFGVTVATPHHA